MRPILEIQNIGKQYQIGGRSKGYLSLRESLTQRMGKGGSEGKDEGKFWALEDVSFNVHAGESIGIVGRNGAGKSTLLKILSRITPPTKGRVIARGRVASLLEVGTGFHQELTGRENVYLNGSILGLRRTEIDQKFDEIVDFSGVEKFLDTPLKHYSSGMQLRLAFAVAAHLEPEILVIDEVLAVGDAEFQNKCLGKMDEVSKSGRTILFVSHNMGAVKKLCQRSILLQNGNVVLDADSDTVVNQYMSSSKRAAAAGSLADKDRKGNGVLRFTDCRFLDAKGQEVGTALAGQELNLELTYTSDLDVLEQVIFRTEFADWSGTVLFLLNNRISQGEFKSIPGKGKIICKIPKLPLNVGQYPINIYARVNKVDSDMVMNAATLQVEHGYFFDTGKLPVKNRGLLVEQQWYVDPV